MFRVFAVGFAVRVIVGFLLLATGWYLYLGPDAATYIDYGHSLAEGWRAGAPATDLPGHIGRSGVGNFVRVNAAVYSLFGRVPAVMIVILAGAGAWTAVLAGQITRKLGDAWAARRVAWLVALFPSLVLWSAMVLRDGLTILGVTGVVWAAIEIREKPTVSRAVVLAGFLALAGSMRGYLFILLAAGVVVSVLGASRFKLVRNYAGAVLGAAVVIGLAVFTGLGSDYYEYIDLERIAAVRHGMTFGAESAYLQEIDISTPQRAVAFIPLGLLYFLFGPFPWDIESLRQALTVPETLFWYWLALKVWPGLKAIAKRNASYAWLLLTVTGSICVTYALVSGNLGTAYRHRAQVMPLLLVVSGIGWSVGRLRRNRSVRAKNGRRLGARSERSHESLGI